MEGKKDELFQKLCYSLSQNEVLDSQIQQIGTQIFTSKYFSVVISKKYHFCRYHQYMQTDRGPFGTSAYSKTICSLTAYNVPAPKLSDSLVGTLLSPFYR